MLVALTGASGHIGGNLTRALLEQGRPLRALVRPDEISSIADLSVEQIVGDVLDPAALDRTFAGADVVYHLAARISVTGDEDYELYRINVEGTRQVVQACLRAGVRRLVHFSSVHAYHQEPLDQPIDETRGPSDRDGVHAYDRSKARGEAEVLAGVQRGLDAVIVNPGSVLGPHDYRPSAVGQVIINLCRRKVPALVAGGYDWVDVRDVVSGAMAAEQRGRCGEKYLLTGHYRTIREFADLVAQVSGVAAPRFVSPMWLARVGAPFATVAAKVAGKEPLFTSRSLHALRNHQHVSHAKATRDLGYQPRPLRETLSATYDWFRETGQLS